jgi:hypothetical protein
MNDKTDTANTVICCINSGLTDNPNTVENPTSDLYVDGSANRSRNHVIILNKVCFGVMTKNTTVSNE